MEWVETTGKTVEEALEAALDQLGVDAADAEYEVVEEAKTGLFGRLRTEARVRARVRPTTPRPKDDRRSRGRKSAGGSARPDRPAKAEAPVDGDAPAPKPKPERSPRKAAAAPKTTTAAREREPQVSDTEQEVPLAEQGEIAAEFLRGVLDRFGAPAASVASHDIDEDTIELRIEGEDLGLLIGPKGAALQSLQELTRTVVQRQTGARSGRILVDVAGYRAKRKEALERFARKVADDVLASSTRVVLEPMSPADRKIIHDACNEIDGVTTSSEGEEPRRRVVVSPA
jgi:spoIIIJ-associated protein